SASGQWPCEAVAMMNRIATRVESDPSYSARVHFTRTLPDPTTADAIAQSANTMVGTVSAATIVCITSSGSTARRVSRERPAVPPDTPQRGGEWIGPSRRKAADDPGERVARARGGEPDAATLEAKAAPIRRDDEAPLALDHRYRAIGFGGLSRGTQRIALHRRT